MNNLSKKRHWSLTLYLIILGLSSLISSILIFLNFDVIKIEKNEITNFDFLTQLQYVSTGIELIGLYYIFKWKKSGIYIIWISCMLGFYISDKTGDPILAAILGVTTRYSILYLILQIKANGVSGWKNLE